MKSEYMAVMADTERTCHARNAFQRYSHPEVDGMWGI